MNSLRSRLVVVQRMRQVEVGAGDSPAYPGVDVVLHRDAVLGGRRVGAVQAVVEGRRHVLGHLDGGKGQREAIVPAGVDVAEAGVARDPDRTPVPVAVYRELAASRVSNSKSSLWNVCGDDFPVAMRLLSES